MAFQLFFRSSDYPTQSPSNFQADVSPAINFTEPFECAVVGGQMVNSAVNLSAAFGNNTLSYSPDNGATWKTVTFPKGAYSTGNIQSQMELTLKANGDYTVVSGTDVFPIVFSASIYLNRVQVTLDAGYKIDFTVSSLCTLLGFASSVLTGAGVFTASSVARSTDTGNFYFLLCDIVDGGINAGPNVGKGLAKLVEGSDIG